ncbi:MAG: hypothetical protein CM15mP117_13350 [Alphaproteobacteria bacterium]|nr:MAG: hypothetical protein CM15mP117_13350 [Alphaproteobacteria bacterium]
MLNCDGHNHEQINKAIELAKANTEEPSLIRCKTSIGFGSPNLAGTAKVHGAPLGKEETELTKSTELEI